LNQTDKPSDRSSTVSGLSHQLRQLGDVHRDPPRFVAREQLGGQAPARLFSNVARRYEANNPVQLAARQATLWRLR
jgi:hypothetical protein